MSILLPEVKQFVVVGAELREELERCDIFNRYFGPRRHQLKFIDSSEELNESNFPDRSQQLFIVKHFDYEPMGPKRLKQDGDNNNHLTYPNLGAHAILPMNHQQQQQQHEIIVTHDKEEEEEEATPTTTTIGCNHTQPTASPSNHLLPSKESSLLNVSSKHNQAPPPGYSFSVLTSNKCSVIGSTALLQTIRLLKHPQEHIMMIPQERPLHNLAMHNMLITFSGIHSKQEAQQLLTLTRYMGAKSREDVTSKTTHLVAGNARGLKYRKALELGLFIMSTNWVYESFRLAQDDIDFEASMPEIIEHYKLKPFQGLNLAFVGFKEEDVKELSELTVANKGFVVTPESLSCTHIVVDAICGDDETNASLFLNPTNASAHVVYREWFWASLEMEGKANEEAHAVPGFKAQTRRSSKGRRASGYHSLSNLLSPMLDYSRSPESMLSLPERHTHSSMTTAGPATPSSQHKDMSKISARQRACLELLQTERNYVKILDTIVKLFKIPLENPTDPNDPILPANDVKTIFGNLMPIYEVHKRLLNNLETLIEANDWNENICIGKVFVTHSIDLLKAYPPFVNFYDGTKSTIINCDAKYPRFHAFLKRCQSKIECNRESLTEMLIRPVQRLPSISLILKELIKRTDDSNPDKKYLVEALESIRRVMNLVNEGRRKTEGQIAMFDIVNNIEDCPPDLLSSNRDFVCKAEAHLLFMNSESEVVPSKSHKVALFLFSDVIEICKIRSLRRSHSSKSSRTYVPIRRGIVTNSQASSKFSHSNKKDYRHLDELLLNDIKNIYKNCQFSEMTEAFVIQARPSPRYDQNFRYYSFIIDDESTSRQVFLERLEEYLCSSESDYVPSTNSVGIEAIDFGYANSLVSSMEKSRISRVLSIRQALLSPSLKSQRNLHHYLNH